MDYTGKEYEEVQDWIKTLPPNEQLREIGRFTMQKTKEKRPLLEAQVRERLDHPSPERVAEIIRTGRFPKRTLPGLRGLETMPANAAGLAAAKAHYVGWAERRHPGDGRGLYFHGEPGTGKTTILTALAFDLLHRGGVHTLPAPEWNGTPLVNDFRRPSVQFWKVAELLEQLQQSFRGRGEFDPAAVTECDVLILDDLGKVRPSDWNLLTLFSWLDVRDSEMRPTWYSSNYTLEQIAQRYIGALGKDYAGDVDALMDRIAGNCEQVEFSGPSWRAG